MPYISKNDDRREQLRNGKPALIAGELNYQIFYYVKHKSTENIDAVIVQNFVDNFLGSKPNYQKYNDMTGCLIRCSREVERRLRKSAFVLIGIMNSYDDKIAEYEDLKIIQNGDVE